MYTLDQIWRLAMRRTLATTCRNARHFRPRDLSYMRSLTVALTSEGPGVWWVRCESE
jgi:hypothetical protein